MAALRGSVSAVFSSAFLFISSLVRLFTPSGPLAEPTFKKRCFLSTALSVVLGSADATDSSCCAAFLAFARAIAAAIAALRGSVSAVFSSAFFTALSVVLGSADVTDSSCCAAFFALARAIAAAMAALRGSVSVGFSSAFLFISSLVRLFTPSGPLAEPTFKKRCFLSTELSIVLGSMVVVGAPCCAAFLAFARARAAATAAFLSSSVVVFVLVNPEDLLASSEPLATPTFKKPCLLSDVFSVS